LKLNEINALIKLEGAFNLPVAVEEIKGVFTSEVFNLEGMIEPRDSQRI
jgi:hypothetical protein